jgi:hypothetical protein
MVERVGAALLVVVKKWKLAAPAIFCVMIFIAAVRNEDRS